MKRALSSILVISALTGSLNVMAGNDIFLSKKIKPELRNKIEKDLDILNNFQFRSNSNQESLKVMGLSKIDSETTSAWLNERVNYVIEEKALSFFNLVFKRAIFVERSGVTFPNSSSIPYSTEMLTAEELANQNIDHEGNSGSDAQKGFVVMSNIGAALYLNGKQEGKVYGLKVSKGFLHKSEKVAVESPRAGIIQIGEGLFSPELAVNRKDDNALANTISRLATFFHEARHSDGNGKSLSFSHAVCPEGHDYAGSAACDENLNGPYTVGRVMMTEMMNSCDNQTCSAADKEILNLMIVDYASRVLKTTHKNEAATNWDATPESL
jgi:hypothetical protein